MAKGIKEPDYHSESEEIDIRYFKSCLEECFGEAEDPRNPSRISYDFVSLLAIIVCAVIAGANGVLEVYMYGKAKRQWLSSWLPLNGNIPCYHTFWWLLTRLKPETLERGFRQWVQLAAQRKLSDSMVRGIAIDGKRLRGASSSNSQDPLVHMVSAWDSAKGLILGQTKTEEKSNEITAMPALIESLDVHGATVTIDAMGCQKNIVAKIVEGGADYVIALKGNQETLHDEVKNFFDQAQQVAPEEADCLVHKTSDEAHGRREQREVWATSNLEWLDQKNDWVGLQTIVAVASERGGVEGALSKETRYYLSSLSSDPERLGKVIRSHWGIENRVHWVLDVTFDEDASQLSGNAATNFSVLRRLTLNILRLDADRKTSLSGKRRKAGWDDNYMSRLLGLAAVNNL